MDVEKVKKALLTKEEPIILHPSDFLSSGSTILNCALSDNPYRGFLKGKSIHLVGDSVSGKTWLAWTMLAEAVANPNFDNHRFIYDGSEGGSLMDISKYFGKRLLGRIEWKHSRYLEEFYFNVDNFLGEGKPFIYIEDSYDILTTYADEHKFEENKKAFEKGKELTGSYGTKAKVNSEYMRQIISKIEKEGQSIIVGISQSRQNFDGFEKTNAGGDALKFDATFQLWTSVKQQITKQVLGKDRQLGIKCLIKIKKNRLNGKERKIIIPIYHSFGIDDVGSCVDYLIEEGHWDKQGDKINASEFNFTGKPEKLVQQIEAESGERELRDLVGETWNEIESACAIKRKSRYE